MGRYDNYNNRKRIEQCRKKLKKLSGKRKPNLFEIDMAQKELDTMLLFESCQIFGRENLLKSINDPNADIMFSDDNRVMWFVSMLVPYEDIVSYRFFRKHRIICSDENQKQRCYFPGYCGRCDRWCDGCRNRSSFRRVNIDHTVL